MRIIVMFDLPVLTSADRKQYRDFRKYLTKTGFLMLQESVYCKLAQNGTVADIIMENLKRNKPQSGLVQALRVTEKQFNRMEYVVGKKATEVIDTDERLIVI